MPEGIYTFEKEHKGKIRKFRVKDVYVDIDGERKKVIIKKLTYGERAEILNNFVKIETLGELEKTSVNVKELRILSLLYGIVEAPFPVNRDYIENELDGEVGEILFKEIDEFNTINKDLKKKLKEHGNTEQTTQQS